MIIWLSSYPKSGNTWIRFFLVSLFFSGRKVNLNHLKKIINFPNRSHFTNLISNFDDISQVGKNWLNAQRILNEDKKVKIFKTHNMLCRYKNNFFTDSENTLATIHVIRDPRNVITSLKNHYNFKDLNITKNFLFNDKQIITLSKIQKEKKLSEHPLPQIIGSWKSHYQSWRNMKKNKLLIKYEDLLSNSENEFFKIATFISKFTKTNFNKDQILHAIKSSSFENLKGMEKEHGFTESTYNSKTGKKNTFFNLGPKNDWEKILDKEITNEINSRFEPEMKELGYL
tara:strand:+ start:891 stop:1745 length:855 start_codon:yes stop_codon:yes gene_type:complete